MSILIKKAVKVTDNILHNTINTNNKISDAVHDLQMYINSGGKCEVTKQEAMQLIKCVVNAHAEITSNLAQAKEWTEAIGERL